MKISKKSIYMVMAICIAMMAITSEGMAQQKVNKKPTTAQKPAARPASTPSTNKAAAKPSNVQRPSTTSSQSTKSRAGDSRDVNNRTDNKNGNFNNNNVNVNNSRGDVNINVDNSKDIKVNNNRNTVVRQNNYRPYTRPPYVYGGYRYNCYHPYYYHPYRPFVWGPVWHPWGFFIATLTATAIIVSFADADLPPMVQTQEIFVRIDQETPANNSFKFSGPNLGYSDPQMFGLASTQALASNPVADEYYYDQGVFYLKEKGGYTVVAAPVGALIKTLPTGYETVVIDETSGVKNYYWGGTFYEKVSNGYKVVPPTSGAVVEHISDGGEEVKIGDVTYVKLGETYFQPTQLNGKNVYEVVDVAEDK